MPKPAAKNATLTLKEVDALLTRFTREVDRNTYQQSHLADDPNVAAILSLDSEGVCAVATRVVEALTDIYARREGKPSPETQKVWIESSGLPLTLLLQRLLKKQLPFSATQLHIFIKYLSRGGASSFTVGPVVGAVVNGIQRGTLSTADFPAVESAAKDIAAGHSTTTIKFASKLAAALKAASPVAPESKSLEPEPLSRLAALLLSRDSLNPSTTISLTDQLLAALTIPPEANANGVASFDPKPFGKHAATIEIINTILADQPGRYHPDPKGSFAPHLKTLVANGLPAVTYTAAALSAMSLKPIKNNYTDPRGMRFYNGRIALSGLVRRLLASIDEVPLESLSEFCHALSRLRTVEHHETVWTRVGEFLATQVAKLDLKKADPSLLINLLRVRERLLRAESPHDRAAGRSFDEAFNIGRGLPLDLGEPWTNRLYTDLRAMKDPARQAWTKVLETCTLANSAQPSAKWLKLADAALAPLKREDILKRLETWLPLVGKNRPSMPGGKIEGRDSSVPCDRAGDILRGLAFIASRYDSPRSAKALGDLAMAGYKMVPGIGARCPKPATASVWALSQLKDPEALSQLSRIRQLVKFGTAKKVLDTALSKLAKELNVSTDELHEMAAPDFGLDSDGAIREEVGDYTIELRIEGPAAEVRILDENNKELKSTPDALKKDATLKQLKALADDIDKMLPAQKDRLERLYHDERQWPAATWRTRYISHPLVGTLARRLIWNFTRGKSTTAAIWHEDGFITAEGKGIEVADEDTVSLWHPSLASPKEVTAWRTFLESRQEGGIKQPFKQAHREVYLLTDAERRTRTYSNRFAAHIIKQNQLNALCQARGWKHTLFVMDSGEPPMLSLPKWNLHAHFLVEPIGDDYFGNAGAYAYLQTDQVAFSRTPRGENLPLSEIPPLAFSEVMRDVDLFIGVCSVGNNPDWQDGGPEGRYRDYWWTYGFGELAGSGDTRKELLTRLIPKLKIAPLCELDGRFLKVQGKLRTYKIHLGSGNILMEPNDQYLCIVPGRDQESKVFLPFEGDRVLAIILSKAFMLADDDKISDSSITSQIKRKK